MSRSYNNEDISVIKKYINKLIINISSAIDNYKDLYDKDELKLLELSRRYFKRYLDKIETNKEKIDTIEINKLFKIEYSIKYLIYEAWKYEIKKGFKFVSWLKDEKYDEAKEVVFANFTDSYKDAFCDCKIGIVYDVDIDGFLAACEKDGATILSENKSGLYTVGFINSNFINSYNLALKIASPKLVMEHGDKNYERYNEIILDRRYIKPREIICLDSCLTAVAESLGQRLRIPVSYVSVRN